MYTDRTETTHRISDPYSVELALHFSLWSLDSRQLGEILLLMKTLWSLEEDMFSEDLVRKLLDVVGLMIRQNLNLEVNNYSFIIFLILNF